MPFTERVPQPPDERAYGCAEGSAHCSVCGDDALPARVRSVDAGAKMGEVLAGGQVIHVALDLVDDVRPGDTVLVHQGFAIAKVAGA